MNDRSRGGWKYADDYTPDIGMAGRGLLLLIVVVMGGAVVATMLL